MGKKWFMLSSCLFVSLLEGAATLSPMGPVTEIISVGTISNISTPIAVSGSASGFLTACESGSGGTVQYLNTLFFDIGTQEWGTLFQTDSGITFISDTTNAPPLLCNTETTAAISWLGDTVGYWNGYAYAGFTTDYGSSWTTILPLEDISQYVVNVGVSGSSDGFMFAWYDLGNNTAPRWAWSTFSGSSWGVTTSGTITNPSGGLGSSPIVAGTIETGFMVSWIGSDANVYAGYSDNEGSTWTTQQITTAANIQYVWMTGNTTGFLAVWQDGDSNIYSEFYDIGSRLWSSPTLVGSSFTNTVTTAGSDEGFVVTWMDGSNNGFAVASVDNGTSWSDPVQLNTIDGSIADQSSQYYDYIWFIGASVIGDTALFTWIDTSGNAQARFYTIGNVLQPPASLSGSLITNNFPFQKELVNRLKWTASPTSGVTSYNVYRNGALIATVSASGALVYNDRSIAKKTSYTYGVTALSSEGESSAITVSLQ